MSHTSDQKELIELLKNLDTNHVPFFEAKKKLQAEGYTESQIAQALYSFSYDGKPNEPKKEDVVTKYFTANPKEAERIAQYILENAKKAERTKRIAEFLASQYAPGPHARAKYELKFADSIGIPYFAPLLAIVPSFLVVMAYDLDNIFIWTGPVLVLAYWLIKKLMENFRP